MKKTRMSALPLCAAAAVTASAVFVVTLILGGFAPFGSKILVCYDALYQYLPLLSDFAETVREGGSLFYSFRTGGVNFYATTLYYLVNPFNLVSLLFPAEKMEEAFTLVIGLCTAATAASAAWYLQKRYARADISTVAFSLLYTFSGFYIAYYYNTMWLMALVLLPLIARGIERLTNGGKPWLYLASLAFAIICSFYMGFMLCIFSVLYFFVCLFSRNINKKGEDDVVLLPVLLKFGASSIAAGGISAITLMPIVFSLSDAFTKNIFAVDSWYFFNPMDFFTVHMPGVVYNTLALTKYTLPAISLGGLVLVLLPMYAFVKSVTKNEKIAHILLVLVFWVSFEIPTIYYIWHGLSDPAGLPYRFSFIYCFILVSMAYQVYIHLAELSKKWLILPAVLLAAVFVYGFFTQTGIYRLELQYALILVTAAFVVLLLTRLLQKGKAQKGMRVIAFVLVCAEGLTLCYTHFIGLERSAYKPYAQDVADAKTQIEAQESGFYRMEFSDSTGITVEAGAMRSGMTGSIYGFNGITTFSSLADSNYALFQFDMGNEGNLANMYSYAQQTPMYNTLFDVQYILDTGGALQSSPYYTQIGNTENLTVYKTNGALGLGILANPEIAEWDGYNNNSLSAQSSLWEAATGASGAVSFLPIASLDCTNCVITSLPVGADAEEDADEPHIHEDEDGESHVHITEDVITQTLAQTDGYYPYQMQSNAYSMTFTVVPEQTQNLFIMCQSGLLDTLTATNGDWTATYAFSNKKLTDLGLCAAGVPIEITVSSSNASAYDTNGNSETGVDDSLYFLVAAVNDEAYQAGLQTLRDNGTLTVTEFSETVITGTVSASKDCVMTMAIPYDYGWTVTLDGEPIELIEHSSHWMMFAVPAGDHEIEMHYFPQGLKEGLLVSVATLLMVLLAALLSKMRAARFAAEAEAEAAETETPPTAPSESDATPAAESNDTPPDKTE